MGFFDIFKKKKKMSDGLEKTRTDFFQNIVNTLTSSVIDDDLYNDLEEQLILADVGPSCAVRLVDELRDEVEINGLHTGQEALDALRDIIRREVSPKTDLDLSGKPAVILVVGVNGVGKTTTIAKLAYLYKDLGKRVMLAAGDTFRAAASEQLETWADRAGVPLVKAGEGADPAAVIFDAVKSATARGYDMVIADTAGRLHNKKGLMDELAKISRSVKKASPDASLEVLLVLDAITGQNAISQAKEFCKAADATGIILTKLDGTAKGGIAIAIAREGGIGVIHKNMSISQQAEQVDMVKRSENGVITNPFWLAPGHTLAEADELMAKYRISGVPICDNGKLIGIITNRDMKFETDMNQLIDNVMTKENLVTAPEGITLEEAKEILRRHKIEKLPIVDDENHLKGLITIKDIEKQIKYPLSAKDDQGRLLCGAGVGITGNMMERVDALVAAHVDVIVVDSAHGHSKNILEAVKKIKAKYPDLQVIAGNIATGAAAQALIDAGADAVKVGIGPGSICTTRIVAGIGVPQISAIMDCYEVAKQSGIPVIADGGIKYSGDMTKAIAAGANVCMMGSMFAGCDEAPGTFELFQGRKYKVYRGMGSIAAMENGSKDRYFQENAKKLVPEGVEGRVAYKGSVEDTVFQLLGGLRSGMGYCGAQDIETLKETGRFVKISAASLKESHPHDIHITKEAPNYSVDDK